MRTRFVCVCVFCVCVCLCVFCVCLCVFCVCLCACVHLVGCQQLLPCVPITTLRYCAILPPPLCLANCLDPTSEYLGHAGAEYAEDDDLDASVTQPMKTCVLCCFVAFVVLVLCQCCAGVGAGVVLCLFCLTTSHTP